MRVVTVAELVAMPAGTLFQHQIDDGRLDPELMILVEPSNVPADFWYTRVTDCREMGEQIDGSRAPYFDEVHSRWGMYEAGDRFAVWEPGEVELLRKLLGG